MPINEETRLIITISNKQPIELLDLTKSFVSIANQFTSYIGKDGQVENREAKLYVQEIKTGSVILALIEFARQGAIPFMENVNTIVGFTSYLKSTYEFFLGKQKTPPTNFTYNDYKDLSQILNPVAKDNASQINVTNTVNNNYNFTLNSTEANAVQNIIERTTKELKEPDISKDEHTKVLLTLYQSRTDIKAKTGNKGIIEDINSKAMPIIFDTENINEQMLHQDFNPNEKIFVVDVRLQHVGGKLAAYKITNLHEVIDKE